MKLINLIENIFIFHFFLPNYYCSNASDFDICRPFQVIDTADDPRELAPWVASLFKRDDEDRLWKYHCGATLVASHVLLTAASCVVSRIDVDIQYHSRYEDFRVVVGLITNDYYAKRDPYAQEAEVSLIQLPIPPVSVHGIPTDFLANLAGIILMSKFNFTKYVQPACALHNAFNAALDSILCQQKNLILVAGFNSMRKSNVTSRLEIFKFKVQPYVPCLTSFVEFATSNKIICGKSVTGETFPCFMEGAGVFFEYSDRTVVFIGVYMSNTATAVKDARASSGGGYIWPLEKSNAQCTSNETAFFTKHGFEKQWLTSLKSCEPNKFPCQSGECFELHKLCDGITHCKDSTDENRVVCTKQKNCTQDQFQCKYGPCIDEYKVCDGKTDCADNSDESDDEKCRETDVKRNIICSPIPSSKGVHTKCFLPEYRGSSLIENCDTWPVPVGTKAQQSCSRYYRGQSHEITCRRNGTWSTNNFLTCLPECGISHQQKIGFVIGGATVGNGSRGEWPWHAAIYKISKNTGTPELHCGGSLISTRVVLTAAHCVTRKDTTHILDDAQLRVVLGKLHSLYEENETDFSQEIEIKTIMKHKSYHPLTYGSDIALIILKTPIEITSYVRPVCFSKDTDFADIQFNNALPNNGTELGTTVGFGLDETKNISAELKILRMPFVPQEVCESKKKEIRVDLICGGYRNGMHKLSCLNDQLRSLVSCTVGSAICQGDSGGGFVFPRDDSYSGNRRYFVQGVVSHGDKSKDKLEDPCNKNSYKYFTKVTIFADWIQKVIDKTEVVVNIDEIGERVDKTGLDIENISADTVEYTTKIENEDATNAP